MYGGKSGVVLLLVYLLISVGGDEIDFWLEGGILNGSSSFCYCKSEGKIGTHNNTYRI